MMKNALATTDYPDGKGKINGVVIDSSSGSKIEYAGVAIYKTLDSKLIGGIITDDKGKFEIKQIPNGKYYLLIQFMGFSTKRIDNIEINIDKQHIQLGNIVLKPTSKQLNEVNITSEKRQIEYKLDKKVINANSQLASSGGTAVDILKNAPSVSVDNEDNVKIRGNSGFQVFINGKPSVLKGSDALKQIPAASIDNIEIITNPSASQDAEGTAGIINIITKKNTFNGSGALFTISCGSDRYGADINLSHQQKKWTYTFGAKYMYYNVPVDITDNRYHQMKDSAFYIKNTMKQFHKTKIKGINFGIDYDLNKFNTFSIALNAGTWRHFHDFTSKYNFHSSLNSNNTYSIGKNEYEIGNQYFSANLFYKHTFAKNHEISTNIFYSLIDGDRNLNSKYDFTNISYNTLSNENMNRNNENNLSKDIRFKIDYIRPFLANINIESGIQLQLKPYDAEMKFDNYNFNNNLWMSDTNYTHNILFNVNLYATYLSLSGNINKFEYKIGLRSEYYDRKFAFKNTSVSYPYDQIDLFPTLHLSYKKSDKNQYQFSVSRRVNRPSAWFMYPVPDYTDNYFVTVGNPDLKPEFINAFEFNYIHNFKRALLSIETFHRRSDGSFNQRFTSNENGVVQQKMENHGNEYFTGIESSLNADIYKWFSVNISASWYYALIKTNLDNIHKTIETNVFNTRLNSSFIPAKNIKLQLAMYYDAPFDYVQSHNSERFNANISVKKDFPKQKASLTFTARNPFWGSTNYIDINETNYYSVLKTEMQASYSFTLTFRLNNYKRAKNVGEQLNVGDGA